MLITLATHAPVPGAIYNSPAVNCHALDLKRNIEALDKNVTVELTGTPGQPIRPVVDGAAFVHDFAWRGSRSIPHQIEH